MIDSNSLLRPTGDGATDILNSAGFRHLSGKSCETIWLRAECPGHGGAGILPAASHAKGLMPVPPSSRCLSLTGKLGGELDLDVFEEESLELAGLEAVGQCHFHLVRRIRRQLRNVGIKSGEGALTA